MRHRKMGWCSLTVCCGLAAAIHPAAAQTQRSGGGEAQRFMQQYQQLAAEKSALQAQLAQMKKDLDAAQADAKAAKKERDEFKAHANGSALAAAQLKRENEAKEAVEKNLEQYKSRTNELVDRFKVTVGELKSVEADRTQLRRDNEALNTALNKCADDNVQLFDISSTVLDRYDQVGFFTKVGAAEPFTRITRTRIDNLVVEYRQRAEAARMKQAHP